MFIVVLSSCPFYTVSAIEVKNRMSTQRASVTVHNEELPAVKLIHLTIFALMRS